MKVETTRCAKCLGIIPRSRFACCATCTYGPEWSKSSVGAGKVVEEYERKMKRLRDRGLGLDEALPAGGASDNSAV